MPSEVDLSPEGRRRLREDCNGWIGEGGLPMAAICREQLVLLDRLEALERVAEAAPACVAELRALASFHFLRDPEDPQEQRALVVDRVADAMEAALRSLDAGHPPAGEEGA